MGRYVGRSLLVRLCLHVTLIKCLKGYKSLGSLLKVVQLQLVWESESTTHPPTNLLTDCARDAKASKKWQYAPSPLDPTILEARDCFKSLLLIRFPRRPLSDVPLLLLPPHRIPSPQVYCIAMHPIYWQFAQILSSIFHSFHCRSKCVTKPFTLS